MRQGLYRIGDPEHIVGNTALIEGGAIFVENSPDLCFEANIFADNESEGSGLFWQSEPPASFACNDAWHNGQQDYGGIDDPTGQDGNIAADPAFCSPDTGSFTLHESSPCLPDSSPPGCGLIGARGIGCGPAEAEGTESLPNPLGIVGR